MKSARLTKTIIVIKCQNWVKIFELLLVQNVNDVYLEIKIDKMQMVDLRR